MGAPDPSTLPHVPGAVEVPLSPIQALPGAVLSCQGEDSPCQPLLSWERDTVRCSLSRSLGCVPEGDLVPGTASSWDSCPWCPAAIFAFLRPPSLQRVFRHTVSGG